MSNIKLSYRRPSVPFSQLSIGQRVQWLLLRKQLTQTATAQRAGITQSALANIMGDRRKPNSETLLKLAKALDSSPEFIFYGDGPPSSWATPEDDIQTELLEIFRYLRNAEQQQLMVFARVLARAPEPHRNGAHLRLTKR